MASLRSASATWSGASWGDEMADPFKHAALRVGKGCLEFLAWRLSGRIGSWSPQSAIVAVSSGGAGAARSLAAKRAWYQRMLAAKAPGRLPASPVSSGRCT